MTIHTIPDPPPECTGANSPRLHKRPSSKDNKRKRTRLIEKYGMQCFWCSTPLTQDLRNWHKAIATFST